MKTFDELFNEASIIGDRRTMIFNQLIEKTESEIIPAFAKMLQKYDISKAFFTIYEKPVNDFVPQKDEEGDDMWCFAVENDGAIWDCEKDIMTGRYSTYKEYCLRGSDKNLPIAQFRRVTIVKIVKLLNNRAEELNKKYAQMVVEAEGLLK